MKNIEVAAAIIINKDQILAVERPEHALSYISNKFEFPGGKIEDGESHKEALMRELQEELEIDAVIGSHVITIEHSYPDFELTMHAYLVKVDTQEITLTEHISQQWLNKENIYSVDWAAADIPIVQEILSL